MRSSPDPIAERVVEVGNGVAAVVLGGGEVPWLEALARGLAGGTASEHCSSWSSALAAGSWEGSDERNCRGGGGSRNLTAIELRNDQEAGMDEEVGVEGGHPWRSMAAGMLLQRARTYTHTYLGQLMGHTIEILFT